MQNAQQFFCHKGELGRIELNLYLVVNTGIKFFLFSLFSLFCFYLVAFASCNYFTLHINS